MDEAIALLPWVNIEEDNDDEQVNYCLWNDGTCGENVHLQQVLSPCSLISPTHTSSPKILLESKIQNPKPDIKVSKAQCRNTREQM